MWLVKRSGFTESARLTVGTNPLLPTTGGGYVWVQNYGSNSVSAMNPLTNTVTNINLGYSSPQYGCWSPTGHLVVGGVSSGTDMVFVSAANLSVAFAISGIGGSIQQPLWVPANDSIWIPDYSLAQAFVFNTNVFGHQYLQGTVGEL